MVEPQSDKEAPRTQLPWWWGRVDPSTTHSLVALDLSVTKWKAILMDLANRTARTNGHQTQAFHGERTASCPSGAYHQQERKMPVCILFAGPGSPLANVSAGRVCWTW